MVRVMPTVFFELLGELKSSAGNRVSGGDSRFATGETCEPYSGRGDAGGLVLGMWRSAVIELACVFGRGRRVMSFVFRHFYHRYRWAWRCCVNGRRVGGLRARVE